MRRHNGEVKDNRLQYNFIHLPWSNVTLKVSVHPFLAIAQFVKSWNTFNDEQKESMQSLFDDNQKDAVMLSLRVWEAWRRCPLDDDEELEIPDDDADDDQEAGDFSEPVIHEQPRPDEKSTKRPREDSGSDIQERAGSANPNKRRRLNAGAEEPDENEPPTVGPVLVAKPSGRGRQVLRGRSILADSVDHNICPNASPRRSGAGGDSTHPQNAPDMGHANAENSEAVDKAEDGGKDGVVQAEYDKESDDEEANPLPDYAPSERISIEEWAIQVSNSLTYSDLPTKTEPEVDKVLAAYRREKARPPPSEPHWTEWEADTAYMYERALRWMYC
ncbi:hypothetical protein PUNSTDRAFT_46903 [Punctularia strigosozonata HHB-11173 SS5]|uniref:uncharacterized protein n=1 Tax=Punctularia strigosozonata (strain HHB-11173) TaxID=741275 RepID=UPI0004417ECC|nr:uncharacterized protein PUNSTDRAFT_46903 [Punctularia strigosozonata HHB-11173 SS5]EIN05584.1 hypothetical protein PUNSTDRAFT_46903 [Punctularia strigosozonata HHB-11173 SS5]